MLLFSCVEISDLCVANVCNYITTKIKYGVPAIILIVVIYWRLAGKRRGKARRVFERSMSLGVLHGGKLALERLVVYHKARADATVLDAAEVEMGRLLAKKHPNFIKLQCPIGSLEMSGKEAAAVKKLENALKMAQEEGRQLEAYEIEMFLVEMLIYKGDYKTAFNSKCLKDEMISDARRPLYKAIINIMLEHPDEKATKCLWEEFKDIQSQFQWPPDLQNNLNYKVITNFNEFKKVVNSLKADIGRD